MNNSAFQFVIVLLLQWIAGLGVLAMLRVELKRSIRLPASLLLGMYLHTVGVFVLELFHIRLSSGSIMAVGAIIAVASNIWWQRVVPSHRLLFARPQWSLRMYDIAALLISTGPLYIAVWATWYWPVTPFDAMAGIDLVARQALIDGHINNRIFTDPSMQGLLSNQPYYAPYAMLMQIVYRSIGFTYGQIWLGVQCVLFAWMMFAWLRSYTHPFIASVLWLLLVLTPEWFGYQFLLQTDMANAVFFTTGAWFFIEGVRRNNTSMLAAASLFLAAAAWSRTETIIIIGFVLAASLPWSVRALGTRRALLWSTSIGLISLVSFGLWHWLYFNAYLPVAPDSVRELVGFDISRVVSISVEFFSGMLANTYLWGHTIILFVLVLIASLVISRRIENPLLLVWISCILVALVIVGTVFTAALVDTTLRRGIFKVLPLMALFMAQASVMQKLSDRLGRWELKRP